MLTGLMAVLSLAAIQPDVSESPARELLNAPKVPAGFRLVEGDILVPLDQPIPAFGFQETNLWPGGDVAFSWDLNLSDPALQAPILEAMAEIESNCMVRFRRVPSGGVQIQRGPNSSPVGYPATLIQLEPTSHRYALMHVLYHLLGFWHENQRPDRDSWIAINEQNMCCPGALNPEPAARGYGPYDFGSIMHLGQFVFTRNGLPTITVLPPNQQWQSVIGQREHLSTFDRLLVSFLYPPPDYRFVDHRNSTGVVDGTFFHPHRTFPPAYTTTPTGGTIWVQPGSYSSVGTYSRPMTIRAPLGNVTLGN